MTFEGQCDTEDWSNDAENSALHHRNKYNFKIYYNRKQLFYIVTKFRNIAVFKYHRWLNKYSLWEHNRLFKNIFTAPHFEQ